MGHFVYAQRHHVYATLPFFLPAPTIIGTFGALIRIRSPIPDRNALMDIGIAGPVAGFLVAVPVLFIALLLSRPLGHASGLPLGLPVIFACVWRIVHPQVVPLAQLNLHPIGFAAWAGFLATSLNLLPGGQLDGGHIVYSITPRLHPLATRLTSIALVPMGIFLWGGWLLWALVLALPWMRHPPVPQIPDLTRKKMLLGLSALLMLALSLAPTPFAQDSPWDKIHPWLVKHVKSAGHNR
jgi:membrane-associated protease RseP (regulator of RpoE activity)